MFPFHTWLPDAHVEAPTPISVILAGVLLKMGIYGILRFNYPLLPDATAWAANAMAVFGVINIVYAAFVCLAQKDLKKLIAYSSVSHMGFSLLGMAAMTPAGISGAVLNLFTHGIISPMLFLIVGVIYDRAHHREIEKFGGLASELPEYTAIMGLAFFASLGLPGLSGFISEFMVFIGAFPVFTTYTIISATRGHHHRRVLPVGDPPDVPRQAEPGLQGLPGPQLARAHLPLPARRHRDRARLLPAGDPRGHQPQPAPPHPEHPAAVGPERDRDGIPPPSRRREPALRALVPAGDGAHVRDARPVRARPPLVRRSPARVALLAAGALAVLAAAAGLLAIQPPDAQTLFNGMLANDSFAIFFKWLFLAAAALTVVIAAQGQDFPPERIGQFFALLMAIVLGMFMMASATDLLMVYMSIELVSMVSYVLAGFRKGDRKAAEGSLKYVIYGGVASGVMIFGMSYLYGLTGTTSLLELGARIQALGAGGAVSVAATRIALVVAIVFVTAGVGYKVAAVPWHMWCPDVYEGAPTPFTAFLSVGPKAAGFALAIRIFHSALAGPSSPTTGFAEALAGHPLAGGHRRHLRGHDDARQPHRARADQPEAAPRVLVHRARGLHAHGPLRGLRPRHAVHHDLHARVPRDERGRVPRRDPRRRGDRAPSRSSTTAGSRGATRVAAVAFAIFLFSLTGLPPFAGFVGKWYLFYAVFERVDGPGGGWYAWLLLIGALNTAVSLYYYVRVVRAMFIDPPYAAEAPAFRPRPGYSLLLGGFSAAILVFGLWWTPMVRWTEASLQLFRG